MASSRRRLEVLAGMLSAGLLLTSCGFQEPPLQPITRELLNRVEIPPISGKTAVMDTMLIDPATHALYVSDGSDPTHQGIDVFDITTPPGRYLKVISTGNAVPSGLAFAPDVHRLYSGNDDGTVSVIDVDPASPHYQTIVDTLNMNGKLGADLLAYDDHDHLLFVSNPDDGFITAVDVRTDQLIGRVENLGLIDQPMFDDADGMLYVGDIDDNLLERINPHTLKVTQRWTFDVACEPHGIAVNPTTNQGLIGCADKDQPVVIAWDFARGQAIRYFDLSGAGDLMTYDQAHNRFVFAASSFAPAEMSFFSGSPINYLTSVPTSHKSHDVAYDDAHGIVYTYDGRLREAALWEFADPMTRCDAQLKHCAPQGAVPDPLANGAPPKGRI